MTCEGLQGKRLAGFFCGLMLALAAGATTSTQLESITGDGNVWIYSGVKPTCTDRVEITFKAKSGNTAALYCARGNTTETATFTAFIIQNGGDTVRLDRNTTTGGPYVKLSLNEPHTLVVDGSLRTKCTWDGNPIDGDLASGDFTPGSVFSLFASHTQGTALSETTAKSQMGNFGTHTLYSFKVYSADGTLVADLVPARNDEAADGTTAQYGLFDRVTHVFHQGLGTGKFTPGAQVGETGGLGKIAGTCTWIGGSSDKWSDAANWADGVAPAPSYKDTVMFDLATGDIDCENDIEGLVLDRLVTVNGTAERLFVLRGKGLTLTGGSNAAGKGSWVGSSKVHCYAPLTFTSDTATLESVNEATRICGGVTLTGTTFFFRGGKTIGFYDKPVVGRNTEFRSGGSNMECQFHVPIRVKCVRSGSGGCNGYIKLFSSGNEIEQSYQQYYGAVSAEAPNAFSTNTVLEWTYDYDATGGYAQKVKYDQIIDRISRPSPLLYKSGDRWIGGVSLGTVAADDRPTVTLRGTGSAVAYAKVLNKISLVWDPVGEYTQTFADRGHTMSGSLTVKGGTLASAGTNSFASVTRLNVFDGATFAVTASDYNEAANPFADKTDLVVSGTGKLSVPSGVTVTFANAVVKGVLQAAKTYQAMDGTDATAEKVGWITGEGLVQVLSSTGTAWTGSGTGAWSDPANWSNGLPSAHPSGTVYLMSETTPFTAEMAATDAWPQNLVIRGAGATLRVTGDVTYSGKSKTSQILVEEGATLQVDGGTLSVTNFGGTFWVSSLCAATSRIEVASGAFLCAPSAQASALRIAAGGELHVSAGEAAVINDYGVSATAAPIDFIGGRVRADGTGEFRLGAKASDGYFGILGGEMTFSGQSKFTKTKGAARLYLQPLDGSEFRVDVTEHASFSPCENNLCVGYEGRYGKSVINLWSDGTHNLPYRTVIGSDAGTAELNMEDGYVKVGPNGLDIGGSRDKKGCVYVRGIFNLSGGGVYYNCGNLPGWGGNAKSLGFNIGYGGYTTVTTGRPYSGEFNQTGGSVTNMDGFLTVGAGYATGAWKMSGGNYKSSHASRNQFIALAGGIGTFEMSGGTFDILSSLFVGGAHTNAFTYASGFVNSGYPIDRHDAEGTVKFSGGTFAVGRSLVLGADGRGTFVREGASGTVTVGGDLVLSNTVANAASGGTLKFVYDETAGVKPLEVGGKLVILPGAKIEVDLGEYGTDSSCKSKRYLVCPAGGIEGSLADADVTITGAAAKDAVVKADAGGLYASIPRGLVLIVR